MSFKKTGIFLSLSVFFLTVIFVLKNIILKVLAASPTGRNAENGFLTLYEVHNKGAAFNILNNHPEILSFIAAVSLLIISAIVIKYGKTMQANFLSSFAMLFAGVAANLYERIAFGYITDYIKIDFLPAFPLFNIADIMIVCGAAGIIFALCVRD